MEDLSQTGRRLVARGAPPDSIEAQCSKDGEKFLTVRQGYFPADVQVMAGVMCAAPEGAGFDATFDQLMLRNT
jgi:regulation of enolase protein 1 (concanavalin A-like superfamily)